MSRPYRHFIAAMIASVALTACTPSTTTTTSEDVTSPAETTTSATEDATASETASETGVSELPTDMPLIRWSTDPGTARESTAFASTAGGDLFITNATWSQEGTSTPFFTLMFEGTDIPQIQTAYVEQAIEDGMGEAIDVGTGSILQILVRGLRYPEPSEADAMVTGAELADYRATILGPFEGQSQVFLTVPQAMNYSVSVYEVDGGYLLSVTFE